MLARAWRVVEVARVAQIVVCPDCHSRAQGDWRDIDAQFYCYHRHFDVTQGWAYPQVYRCRSCGYVFGQNYPAGIDYPLDKQAEGC